MSPIAFGHRKAVSYRMGDAHLLLTAFLHQIALTLFFKEVGANDMPAYGKKSQPPRKAIKEMVSKQSEHSGKDHLHSGAHRPKRKSEKTQ
jgi:hypothetical protein